MYVRHAPPGRFREDRARPPGMRAVRARAASPGAAGTATEAPASVFLGRARALRPRSSPASSRLAASPAGQNVEPHAGARHATFRAFRCRATARVRSARSLERRVARLNCRDARGSAVRSAREGRSAEARATHFWRAICESEAEKRSVSVRKNVSEKISLLQCVRSLEKGLSIYVREVFSDDPVLSAKIPKRRESVARTHLNERSIFVLSL